jgi:ribosomal 50S subunit-recycling heat shock protein
MRLDKFLPAVGLVVRRTRAKQACDADLVEINGKPAKASAEVQVGQQITLRLGLRVATYEVLDVPLRAVAKETRDQYRRLISEERLELDL